MSWLDPVRAVLDAAPAPQPVFFRDDDAGWGDYRLRALLATFERHQVPLDLAVIPAELRAPLAADLRARAAAGTVGLHQHGWAHVSHETTGRKHEFGPARDAARQAADVVRGREHLAVHFGHLAQPVFTPPWNRCTPETGDVLVAAGFRVLSRDSTAPPLDRPDLREVPITVDWFGHRKGTRWTRDQLGEVLADRLGRDGPVGVMLHHAVTDDADLAAVDELVALVAAHPAAEPTTILGVARSSTPGAGYPLGV